MWTASASSNGELAENLRRKGIVESEAVVNAFRRVDRALFFPSARPEEAYEDTPLRDGVLHLSAPHMYALALDMLELEPGLSVLNVGSGSGYFSHLMAALVGPTGVHHGIEWHASNVELARRVHETVGPLLGVAIVFATGSCFDLDPAKCMKYDRIYVGAGAAAADEQFFKKFLAPGGLLVAPIDQDFVKVRQLFNGQFTRQEVSRVGFMPLIGTPHPNSATPDGKFTHFTVEPWSPATHHTFPRKFRAGIFQLMCVHRSSRSTVHELPDEVWEHVLSMCDRNWFVSSAEQEALAARAHAADEASRRTIADRNAREQERERSQLQALLGRAGGMQLMLPGGFVTIRVVDGQIVVVESSDDEEDDEDDEDEDGDEDMAGEDMDTDGEEDEESSSDVDVEHESGADADDDMTGASSTGHTSS